MTDLSKTKIIITDIDGTWTDGSLWYDRNGESIKQFNVKDGLGVRLLQEINVVVAVVSGRSSEALIDRLTKLGIKDFILGAENKQAACSQILHRHNIKPSQAVYIGDDLNDISAMRFCGTSVAVSNSSYETKVEADFVIDTKGGEGAFRELAERIIRAKGYDLIELALSIYK